MVQGSVEPCGTHTHTHNQNKQTIAARGRFSLLHSPLHRQMRSWPPTDNLLPPPCPLHHCITSPRSSNCQARSLQNTQPSNTDMVPVTLSGAHQSGIWSLTGESQLSLSAHWPVHKSQSWRSLAAGGRWWMVFNASGLWLLTFVIFLFRSVFAGYLEKRQNRLWKSTDETVDKYLLMNILLFFHCIPSDELYIFGYRCVPGCNVWQAFI